jgi:fission process protein 1
MCRLVNTIGFERGLDTLVWQLIASVAAPGYTIHTVVAAITSLIRTAEQSPQVREALTSLSAAVGIPPDVFVETFNKSVPTACGLAAIPFIVHPIDAGVHAVLNATLRPVMRRYICGAAGGEAAGLLICGDACKAE